MPQRYLGANEKIDNIQTVSMATPGLKMVVENCNKISSTHNVSSKHTTKATKDDELSTVNDLMKLRLLITKMAKVSGHC